jgi:hypothetical protein
MYHVGQRQVDDGGVEQQSVERGGDDTRKLQPDAIQMEQSGRSLLHDHRAEDDEGADGADQNHLADGEARHQPFAHGVVEREHEIAGQHQQDAGHNHVAVHESGQARHGAFPGKAILADNALLSAPRGFCEQIRLGQGRGGYFAFTGT